MSISGSPPISDLQKPQQNSRFLNRADPYPESCLFTPPKLPCQHSKDCREWMLGNCSIDDRRTAVTYCDMSGFCKFAGSGQRPPFFQSFYRL